MALCASNRDGAGAGTGFRDTLAAMSETHAMPSGTPLTSRRSRRPWLWAGMAVAIATLVTACGTAPDAVGTGAGPGPAPGTSSASTALAYRQDAARRIYDLNGHRIYKGTLPPMLYAVGVLQVQLDAQGRVLRLQWMRAPRHAPEVVAEIERTVRAAAPFPVPARLGKVTYTDTWLWDKSGRFQLDTLTEGQRGL
ncbi:hypothetical protein GCM10027082_17480 [Comamonas humi]